MPRSDSGRAAARGGLRDALRTVIQAFRIEEEPWWQSVRLAVSAGAGRTTPALAWDHRPVPSPAPPHPRRGIKMCNSQMVSRLWSGPTGYAPPQPRPTAIAFLSFESRGTTTNCRPLLSEAQKEPAKTYSFDLLRVRSQSILKDELRSDAAESQIFNFGIQVYGRGRARPR